MPAWAPPLHRRGDGQGEGAGHGRPLRRRPPGQRSGVDRTAIQAATPHADPPPPVRHRWDASTVAGLLAVLFGVAWLIGATGVLHVSIEAVVAIGLMLLGASLVVTGRTDWSLSRRSWPVWLGIGLIGVLVATSSTFGLGGALDSVSFGNKTVTAQGGALPSGTVHGGFGNLVVDLSHATKAGTVKVVSVAGNTTVQVPANATVDRRRSGRRWTDLRQRQGRFRWSRSPGPQRRTTELGGHTARIRRSPCMCTRSSARFSSAARGVRPMTRRGGHLPVPDGPGRGRHLLPAPGGGLPAR